MRLIFCVLSLLPLAILAQIEVPDRPVTDPRNVSSPSNLEATPVPIADLGVSRGVRGAAWSIDGRNAFVSTDLTGRFNLWRVSAAGSWPVQLTQSDEAQIWPVPSPDGASLVYHQDVGGNEHYDLYSVPTRGGAIVRLTETPDVTELNPRFSPDGRSIAFEIKAATESSFNVALMDAATRTIRRLTAEPEGPLNWQLVGWTPDGRSLIANRLKLDLSEASIWRIDVATGDAAPLVPPVQDDFTAASGVSPDGRLIAVTSNADGGQMRAGLFDAHSNRYRWLNPTPWEQTSGQFSPDGRYLVTRTSDNGRSTLGLVEVATLAERAIALPPGRNNEGASLTPSFAPDSRRLLVMHSSANMPGDLWVVDVATGESRPLTQLAIGSLDAEVLPRSEIVTYESFDGTPVSAVLTVPYNLRRDGSNAAIVVPHGGPTGQAEDTFDPYATALASRGFMIIQPNFRGSTGYGRDFMMANKNDLGGGDLRDVLGARDFLIATGYVDPRRVGIAGASYGGFMTLMALGKAPDAFAAGVQLFGIINWLTLYESSDPLLQQYLNGLLGDPVQNRAQYEASSPLTYIRQAKAPLLSLQGDNDIRVPRGQAEEVATVLREQGTEVETVFYPGEGHGFQRQENVLDSMRRSVEWFERHLSTAE